MNLSSGLLVEGEVVTTAVSPLLRLRTLGEVEREHIELVLTKEKSKKKAAEILGISLKNLYNRIERYGWTERFVNSYAKTREKKKIE